MRKSVRRITGSITGSIGFLSVVGWIFGLPGSLDDAAWWLALVRKMSGSLFFLMIAITLAIGGTLLATAELWWPGRKYLRYIAWENAARVILYSAIKHDAKKLYGFNSLIDNQMNSVFRFIVYFSEKGILRLRGRHEDDLRLMPIDASLYLYDETNRNLMWRGIGEQPPFAEIVVRRLDLLKLLLRIRLLLIFGRLDDLFS